MRVLLVQPEASLREAIERALVGAGHEVVCAESGEQAIDRFVQRPCGALVVDLDLPGRNGAATIESIRWAPLGKGIAVVLTGARANPEELRAVARRLGVEAVADAQPAAIAARLVSIEPAEVTREVPTPEDTEEPPDDLYPPDRATSPAFDPDGDREGRDVERRAGAIERSPQRAGRLEDIPFPRLVASLADARATGALVLTSAGDPRQTTTGESPKKVVFFRNGIPIHVRSNLVDECLGQLLRRRGLIDEATLEESLERVRQGAGRQGGILVALGAITPHQLRDTLEGQQRDKLFDVFAWPAGGFAFTARMTPPAETVTLEMSLAEMVYSGIRQRVPAQRALARLDPLLERFVAPTDRSFRGLGRIVGDKARRLLARVDGTRTVRQLLDQHADRTEAAAVLWAAHCLGALATETTPTPVQWDEPPEEQSEEVRLLQRLVPLLRQGRYAEALQLDGDGSDVRRSASELRRRLRALAEAAGSPEALRTLATETLARLSRAEAIVTGDAGPPTLHPPAPPTTAAAETTKHHDAAGARAQPAGPHAESQGDREPSRGGAPPTSPTSKDASRESDAATPPETADLDQRVGRMLEAERHFRRGLRAQQRGHWERAEAAFGRAVELVPDEGEFLVHLAWARFQRNESEAARRDALADLERGCRLVPKSDQAHLLRARALHALGDLAAARNAYERALSANPECHDALDELRALG